MAWRRFGIPREELATMRAAVARVAELEPELAMKTAALYSIAEAGLVFKLEAAKNEREAERARADKAEARVAELEVSFSAVDSDLGQAGSLMAAAQEFTRVVCELLGNEGSGMDVSTDVLQDMLTAAGVTR
jgi:hypothetical protein